MTVTILFFTFAFSYVLLNVLFVLIRNYRAHRFYENYSPKLPTLPEPSIFSGHMWNVTFQDKSWRIIDSLHAKYGPTFGYYMCNQPWVSTKDIDLIKLIEMDKPHKHINRTKFGLPFKEFTDSIFQVDGDQWRRVRRAIAPALTNQKVKSDSVSSDIEHVLSQLADSIEQRMKLAKNLTGKRSILVDAGDMFHRYTLAVIFLITYKCDGKIDFTAKRDRWVEDITTSARSIKHPLIKLSVMFPFLRWLTASLIEFHPMGKLRAQLVEYIVKATDINRHAREQHNQLQRSISIETGKPARQFSQLVKTGTFKRRLVDTIIDALIDKRVKYDEFVGSLAFLLLAGFETTAVTITCFVWHLAKRPTIQEKLREAIRKDGLDADYLAWCIQETIRWHPAVPLGTGRILGEDVRVNGLFLAKGTFVMPSTYSIHHDPDIWSDPDEFKPERWRNPGEYHHAAFMGFGLGPRNCVGGKLAVHEIKLVMKYLLSTFKIVECAETPDNYEFSTPGLLYTILDNPIKVELVDLENKSIQDRLD